eukprot:tig00021179_g19288.t1
MTPAAPAVVATYELIKMGRGFSFKKKSTEASSTHVRFSDVAGIDSTKEELVQLVHFLRNPVAFNDIGAKLPKGVLLCGPPGTGKTLLAKALAGEANVPFFAVTGSEFVEVWAGLGASRGRQLFAQAKKAAPAVIFIDEIDTVGRARGPSAMPNNVEGEQTLNQLLTEMDGFTGSTGVVVLAATNRPDVLDPALRRPGRFDREIHISLPDAAGRQSILEVHSRGVKLAPTADLAIVAEATEGCAGADLANLVNEAALLAVKHGHKAVEQEDLMEAVERSRMIRENLHVSYAGGPNALSNGIFANVGKEAMGAPRRGPAAPAGYLGTRSQVHESLRAPVPHAQGQHRPAPQHSGAGAEAMEAQRQAAEAATMRSHMQAAIAIRQLGVAGLLHPTALQHIKSRFGRFFGADADESAAPPPRGREVEAEQYNPPPTVPQLPRPAHVHHLHRVPSHHHHQTSSVLRVEAGAAAAKDGAPAQGEPAQAVEAEAEPQRAQEAVQQQQQQRYL